jgi:hypothetical protein
MWKEYIGSYLTVFMVDHLITGYFTLKISTLERGEIPSTPAISQQACQEEN